MIYQVVYTRAVAEAIEAQVEWYLSEQVDSQVIHQWLRELMSQIESLSEMPGRYPVAQLISRVKGYKIHRMNMGEHAVYYRIDAESERVTLLAFRHGAQRPWEDE